MAQTTTLADIAKQLEKAMTPKLAPDCMDKQDTTMAQDLVEIVNTHALGAAASGIGVAWLPGVGSAAALLSMVGFIWSMYFRINNRLGLRFAKVIVKTLASAVLSNLAQAAISIAGTVVLSTILSFTGVGNTVASLIMAALDYSIVMVGGILYLKLINRLMGAGNNPDEMSSVELEIAMDEVIRNENVQSLLKQSKANYTIGRKNGTITGNETVDLVD